jgi:putative membrane protein insertion efficiency factor
MSYRERAGVGTRERAETTTRERWARALFTLYKRGVSPLLNVFGTTQCKYLPTCSEYAYVAVVRHGWFRGGAMAVWRLLRCHPFARGGHDPVP